MNKSGLCLVVLGALVASIHGTSTREAHAGDGYDCAKAEKWVKRTSSYDRSTVVSYKVRSSDFHYHAFKCDSGYCTSEPTKSRDWQDLGECKYGTDPH